MIEMEGGKAALPPRESPLESPPSPDFHGFGSGTVFPERLILEIVGEGEEEEVIRVSKTDKKRVGRPEKGWDQESISAKSNILDTPRRGQEPRVETPSSSSGNPSSKSLPKQVGGSKTRPKTYLLDMLGTSLGFAKLPKTRAVLSSFLFKLEEKKEPDTAAQETLHDLKLVWKHHFGERVIEGYDTNLKEATKVMVIKDIHAKAKIKSTWKQWMELERTARRPDRANKPSFIAKEESFVREVLDMPFNITRADYATVLKEDSGIIDWKEDLLHLENQLKREQIGSCDSLDFKQKKRDKNKLEAKLKAMRGQARRVTGPGMDEIEDVDDNLDMEEDDQDETDKDFQAKPIGKKRVDVMGPISVTADRLGLTMRQRCTIAASVANSLNVDIDDTNISQNSAWRRAREERVKLSNTIREEFKKPDKALLHWDGKILSVKGNTKSNRVCVYISGVGDDNTKKLLGAPETEAGTGAAEAEVVKSALTQWGMKQEICGMVFDTTSSNSGENIGACKLIEDWLGSPVLWLACRHHVHELHLKRVVQGVTGLTKDPGVALFRRLKAQWHTLTIDYNDLSKLNTASLPQWMQEEAVSVLSWAEAELVKNTWPREDYRELLRLTIVALGGVVPGFVFLQPGPDHHARWMSKCLYYLKMKLLSNVFTMSEEEKSQVEEISQFILILYVKAWFMSPLPTAAARNDLQFMVNMSKYRLVTRPRIAMDLLQSCTRHLWYLVPQTVILALFDPDLSSGQKEGIASKLFCMERKAIGTGKPVFPYIALSGSEIPDMSTFVTSDSWLIFDFLALTESQDWLTIPSNLWQNFSDFRKLSVFANSLTVCNDIADRGVALISAFINKAQSEEQREALLQVVEFHRSLVSDTNKSSLKKC